jgi:hypothetical protein
MGTSLTIEAPQRVRGKTAGDVGTVRPQPAQASAPPRMQRTRHQWVDALVTISVMACFAATLVAMAGEALA